jgi:predicted amidohydrolase
LARVAVVQTDPHLGDKPHNLAQVESQIARCAADAAQLVVFPECAVTGYMYASLEEALGQAETIPGPASDRIAEATSRNGTYAVVGMLERHGERCFNTAILAGPEGLIGTYRKSHILCLGVDRFTTPGGDGFSVVQLSFGRVGILICYDLRFPEAARSLALAGVQADVFTRARAAENQVFVIAADRVGEERGARFLGRSQVVEPSGRVLAEASSSDLDTIVLDVDLSSGDVKNVVVRPGEHEMDVLADRRPELYGRLVEPVRSEPDRATVQRVS